MNFLQKNYAILTLAVEDCTGLWEAQWAIRKEPSEEHKEIEHQTILEARSIIQDFLLREWIELHHNDRWIQGKEIKISSREEENKFLQNYIYWAPPKNDKDGYICFYATEKGKTLWLQGEEVFYTLL